MTFRDKVKRVFHRSSSSTSQLSSNGRPKVEYYRRHEVPPSKFRGPFDKEHQKRLAAWSFDGAMAERPRSLDLSLSPCATCDAPSPEDSDDTADVLPDHDGVPTDPASISSPDSADVSPRLLNTGSESSTVVNPDSHSGSMMTLLPETSVYEFPEDPIAQIKESIRYTSPIMRAITPVTKGTMSPRTMQLPFSPEDLTRALIAVQVCA